MDPIGNATRPYDGPALDELPLEDQQRDVLACYVGSICGENAAAWSITHQDLINAFYYAGSLEDIGGWHLVTRAGLDYVGEDRDETYTGPVIEELPGLTQNQKDAIMAALGLGESPVCEIPEEPEETGSLSGEQPLELDIPAELSEEPSVQATYGQDVDNQAVINAFYLTAIRLDRVGRQLMAAAGVSALVNDRLAVYTGPKVEEMPGLTAEERNSIAGLLGVDLGGLVVDEIITSVPDPLAPQYEQPSDLEIIAAPEPEPQLQPEPVFKPEPEIPAGPTYPGLVNQDMINLFYKAASITGENGLHWIVRCGLGHIAVSRGSRFESYHGPVVDALPSLTMEQRTALSEELSLLAA